MKKLLSILLIFSLILTACSKEEKTSSTEQTNQTTKTQTTDKKEAFDFKAKDAENKEIKLSDFKGKKVYINMWASWCGPCINEIPELEKVYKKLQNKEDIVFLSITSPNDAEFKNANAQDKTKKIILDKAKDLGVTYPVLFDVNDRFIINYSIRAFPTHIFINSDGTINSQIPGSINEETLEKNINDLT